MDKDKIKQLADYAISECTQHSEDGNGQFLMKNCVTVSVQKYFRATGTADCLQKNYGREKK